MAEEGSKTLVVVGVVLGGLCLLACLAGGAFLFLFRVASTPAPVVVTAPAVVPPAVAPPARGSLTVAVLADAGVVFEDARVSDAELVDLLKARFATEGDVMIVLQADERVPHGRVVEVIGLTKQAGFTDFALGVREAP